jgi:hypothetical protein
MASSINASTSGAGGVITTADSSGVLNIQTAGNTAVTVDASQNVGIGTTTPSGKFHVANGDIYITNGYALKYSATSYITPEDNSIGARISAGTITMWSGSTPAERMRIDSSGNVLVGTSSVPSSSNSGVRLGIPGNNFWISFANTTANYAQFILGNPNGQVGSISTSGTSTAFTTSSDYRLKEDVAPMAGALDTVAALKPVTYKWKVDGTEGQGFIAHELAEIVPDCVSGEKDAVDAEGNPVYQGVDTSFLVATLTAAIQEQQTIINDLKARITALEGAA